MGCLGVTDSGYGYGYSYAWGLFSTWIFGRFTNRVLTPAHLTLTVMITIRGRAHTVYILEYKYYCFVREWNFFGFNFSILIWRMHLRLSLSSWSLNCWFFQLFSCNMLCQLSCILFGLAVSKACFMQLSQDVCSKSKRKDGSIRWGCRKGYS